MDKYNKEPLKMINGIKDFSDKDFYWGIISKEEMNSFNDLARMVGYEKAKSNFSFSGRFDYAENYRRADFHFLLPTKNDAEILDVGSGFGNITIPLSKFYSKITAVDASLPLLEFSKIRADELGIKNIDFVHVDSLDNCNLPFKEKSFDAIILNGVLEWVGAPDDSGFSPGNIQINFLKHLRSLLKEDGVLYIGIENRLFPGWIKRDPHSKLKWTSILPRHFANIYAKKHKQKNYRTYIYSYRGYKKLLKKAGLGIDKTYFPQTSYREPDYIYSDDSEVKNYLYKNNFIFKILTKKWSNFVKLSSIFGLETILLSSFMFFSSKSGKIYRPAIAYLLDGNITDMVDNDIFIKIKSETNKAEFLVFHKDTNKPYVKVCFSRINELKDIEIEYLK
jgi:SAM-dependent methyltransferase